MQVSYLERHLTVSDDVDAGDSGELDHSTITRTVVHAAVDVAGTVYEFMPKDECRLNGENYEGQVVIGKSRVREFTTVIPMGATYLGHNDIKSFTIPVKESWYRNSSQAFARGLVRFLLPRMCKYSVPLVLETDSTLPDSHSTSSSESRSSGSSSPSSSAQFTFPSMSRFKSLPQLDTRSSNRAEERALVDSLRSVLSQRKQCAPVKAARHRRAIESTRTL